MIKNKFGYISLVGKPNVGKSTLFNKIFGNNYSAISHKRHTTRESLFGILTFKIVNFVFMTTLDTDMKKITGQKLSQISL